MVIPDFLSKRNAYMIVRCWRGIPRSARSSLMKPKRQLTDFFPWLEKHLGLSIVTKQLGSWSFTLFSCMVHPLAVR